MTRVAPNKQGDQACIPEHVPNKEGDPACIPEHVLAARVPGTALQATFIALHEGFLRSAGADDSGCTALAAVCTPHSVWLANAGDCQCHLWRGEELIRLTQEHTAALPAERARVEAAGATVSTTKDGKMRVGGIIQVSLGWPLIANPDCL